MTVKYTCPKCNRRFADWGAEKIGYKCPHDENCPPGTEDEVIELLRAGATPPETVPEKPTLKRKKAAPSIVQESDLLTGGDDLEVVDALDSEVEDDDDGNAPVVKTRKKKAAPSENDDLSDDDDSPEEEVAALDFEDTESADISDGFTEVDDDT